MTTRLAALALLSFLALPPGGARADAGADFAEKAAKEKGAVRTASGLVFLSLVDGKGPKPAAAATVKVNYRGTFIDGKVFDSSERSGGPISFPLKRVIKCWTEGLQLMRVGGAAQLVCPPAIAYGERGTDGIPPGSTLVFEVELLEIAE
jgi:FKBP-type peptidyl-prolyl cis-trans isomerase FkpA